VRVRAVFEQEEVAIAGEGDQRVEVDREAVEMDDQQRARLRRDPRGEVVEVGAEVAQADVDRDRAVGRRRPTPRRRP
jgi:hypothetical protein